MNRFLTRSSVVAALALAAAIPLQAGEGQAKDSPAADSKTVQGGAKTAEAKDVSYVGWIVDEWCGAKNANTEGKTCSLECHQKGAKLVLYVPQTKSTVALDDQEKAAKNVGLEVRVKGKLEGETLKVSSIEEAKKS